MRPLAVRSLSLRGFRNLASVDVELGPRINVVAGDNAQGKTNLLEALYVLATSRSFRAAKLGDMVGWGHDAASLRATVVEAGETREQIVGMRPSVRVVRVDGKRPDTLAAYALRTPTVVFHPGALSLSSGGGTERRKLLDRVALYLEPASLAALDAYSKAMRSRQRVLELRGESATDLDAWESLALRHGLEVAAARGRAAKELGPAAARAFSRIGAAGSSLDVAYRPGGPVDAAELRARWVAERRRDRARGAASSGPHRDDLDLRLDGQRVRGVASQGQQRAVVLALQLAEISVIAEARGVRPLLLLDDVSSELDRARTAALIGTLQEERGQVVITTTRPELIELLGGGAQDLDHRWDFSVAGGKIRRCHPDHS